MRLIVAILFLAFVQSAAAEIRKYAVLSLVGDQLLITQPSTPGGSRAHRNFVPVGGPALDREAVFAVEDAIKRRNKEAQVVLLGASDPALFEAQRMMLDQNGATGAFLPTIKGVLASANATHLILVSKHRGEARLRTGRGHIGSGTLEGLGFYLDSTTRMKKTSTGEMSHGFIAPFAYMRVSLVDLSSGTVVREENVIASTTVSSQNADTTWQILSSEEKARILRSLIRREIDRVMPQLLK